jgi:hypothetical protein
MYEKKNNNKSVVPIVCVYIQYTIIILLQTHGRKIQYIYISIVDYISNYNTILALF